MYQRILTAAILGTLLITVPTLAQDKAEQETDPIAFSVADGKLNFNAPGVWTKVQPRVNFIEAEFSIPKEEGDPKNGRLTIMGAGGSVDANIERWYGQFSQPDGGDTSEVAKVEEITVKDMTVHMVDITGTFTDTSGGPFNPNAKKVDRDNYRMLAAIIETEEDGNYFLKMYGPKPTIDKHTRGFKKMLLGIQLAD